MEGQRALGDATRSQWVNRSHCRPTYRVFVTHSARFSIERRSRHAAVATMSTHDMRRNVSRCAPLRLVFE